MLPYLIFKTIFISPINSTSTGRIFTLNSPFGSAVAVDERSLRMVPFDKISYIFISPDHMPISRCFRVTAKKWNFWKRKLVAVATSLENSKTSKSCCNFKTTRDRQMVRKYRKFRFLSNGTICNDLDWPWEPKLFPMCTTPSGPISAGFCLDCRRTDIDDSFQFGLRSLKGRCHGNKRIFCYAHLFDLLYSSGHDSFRIVELLQIWWGFVVLLVVELF